jgi:gliding motility-associated-like protein
MIQLNGVITGADTSGVWTTLNTGTFFPSPNYLNGMYQPSAGDVASGFVTLILTSTANFGCPPNDDTLIITFKEIPVANFNSVDVCQGLNMNFSDATSISSGSITSWTWDFGDNGSSIAQNPQHTYNVSGTMNVQLIAGASNGCSDTIVKPVNVFPLPNPSFTNSIACEKSTTYFTNTSNIATGSINTYLYDFNGLSTSTQANPSYIFPTSGTFNITLTATSDKGCVNTAVQPITVSPLPNANFTATPNPALVDQTITFTDVTAGNINTWTWNFGDGQGSNTEITTHSYSNGGTYQVILTVTDNIGCKDTVSRNIAIALMPVLPTGFTPNGDGENDVFIIRGGPFQSVDFKIYNNWGELLFQSNDQSVGWDGTYKGEPAALGVYTWTFVVDMGSDYIIKQSGDVTLIR